MKEGQQKVKAIRQLMIAAIVFTLLIPAGVRPQTGSADAPQHAHAAINWPMYQDMAVDLMRQYLRIDTSNPPGNEILAAKFFKEIFDREKIQGEIFEYLRVGPRSPLSP
jgi:hypothetical protein